ncbi:MAG: amidase [Ilumatobacteraceae bacterium]|jgi:amidase|nr:amidase [Ilumatobacteraceae bacterium]
MDELFDTNDATGLAALVRDRKVLPRELIEFAISRVEERNPVINALVATRFERALEESDHPPSGPLAGVPFVVKDLGLNVEGLPSTGGSRLYRNVVASNDSELTRRYKRAGLILLGNTNTPELGRNASTESVLFGPCRNPWNLGHSTGGSSGGSAAAVAAGLVPAAHATDGGGSIRIPAAACGLFGLKPSRGRVTAAPSHALFRGPLSIAHAVTRTVRDSALLLDVAQGAHVGDPFVIAPPTRPYVQEVGESPGRLRVAVDLATPSGVEVHEDCARVVDETVELLESLGHVVVRARPVFPLDALATCMQIYMGVPMAADIDAFLREEGRALRDDDLEELTRYIYEMGKEARAVDLAHAAGELERAAQEIGAFFTGVDVLLTPTLSRQVPPLGLLDTMNMASIATHAGAYSALTSPYNITGQPAMSLPLGFDSNGLPVGVQVVAAFGREDVLIRLASQIEVVAPWRAAPMWPPNPA